MRPRVLLLALALAALALRASMAGYGLPHTFHYDEMRYVGSAARMAETGLRVEDARYGPAWSATLAAGFGTLYAGGRLTGAWSDVEEFRAHYFRDPSVFLATGRLLASLAGALSVLAVFVAARGFLRGRGGATRIDRYGFGVRVDPVAGTGPWLAAGALATAPAAVLAGGVALAESQLLLLLSLWILGAATVRQRGGRTPLAISGLLLGLAAATKYSALFFLPWQLLLPLLGPDRRRAGTWIVAGLAPAAGFALGAPGLVLEPGTLVEALRFNAAVSSTGTGSLTGLAHALGEALAGSPDRFLGPAGGILAVLGTPFLIARGRAAGWWLASAGWAFLIATLAAAGSGAPPRYLLPALPPLAVAAGAALEGFTRWMAARHGALPVPLVAGTLAVLLLPASVSSMERALRFQRTDTREAVRAWIEANVPAGTAVLLEDAVASPPLDPVPAAVPRDPRGERRAAALARDAASPYDLHWLPVPWGMADSTEAARLRTSGRILPGFSAEDRELLSPEAWRERGIQLVAVSSFVYARQFREDGDALPAYRRFYERLFEEGELLHREDPAEGNRPGPEIRVYLLPAPPGSSGPGG